MKKGKKLIIGVVILVLLSTCLMLVAYLCDVNNYKKKVQEITFSDIDISNLSDGTYEGEYDVNYIYAKVQVIIAKGRIEDITILKHKHERGAAAEKIVDKIVEEQRVNVDGVSGATNSSKVIKKAVEKALSEAIEQ